MKVYDGSGVILGRLASVVAKDILLGEEVKIINSEKVIISGNKFDVLAREYQRLQRGGHPHRSQIRTRLPDRFVRRCIRGMIHWKQARGKEAYKRVLCYRGVPPEFAQIKPIILAKESAKKLPTLKYISVGEVCKRLGGKR